MSRMGGTGSSRTSNSGAVFAGRPVAGDCPKEDKIAEVNKRRARRWRMGGWVTCMAACLEPLIKESGLYYDFVNYVGASGWGMDLDVCDESGTSGVVELSPCHARHGTCLVRGHVEPVWASVSDFYLW